MKNSYFRLFNGKKGSIRFFSYEENQTDPLTIKKISYGELTLETVGDHNTCIFCTPVYCASWLRMVSVWK